MSLDIRSIRFGLILALSGVLVFSSADAMAEGRSGEEVVSTTCFACHLSGVLEAPKLGNKEDWAPRIEKGHAILLDHALNGFQAMPARGGNPQFSDEEIRGAVAHMLKLVGAELAVSEVPAPPPGPKWEKEVPVPKVAAPVAKATEPAPKVAEPAPKKEAAAAPAAEAAPAANPAKPSPAANPSVNNFNRLLKPPSLRNPPPPEDGIHDPSNDGTHALQPPREAFATLVKGNSGNRVDWVKSLAENQIDPRYDRDDPSKKPLVLDLNIVREVKGSMPNVVYPHKQHTEWLDCSNCHPAIFIPQKGANQISMASILMGEKCGVCHGKVAFPVSECRKCHSQNKPRKVSN